MVWRMWHLQCAFTKMFKKGHTMTSNEYHDDNISLERDEDGDFFLSIRATDTFLYIEREEMRSILEGVYALLEAEDQAPGEIEGVTR